MNGWHRDSVLDSVVASGSGNVSHFIDGSHSKQCCLFDGGVRCSRPVIGSTLFTRKLQRIVLQNKLKLMLDPQVGHEQLCSHHHQLILNTNTISHISNAGSQGTDVVPVYATPKKNSTIHLSNNISRHKSTRATTAATLSKDSAVGDAVRDAVTTKATALRNSDDIANNAVSEASKRRRKRHHSGSVGATERSKSSASPFDDNTFEQQQLRPSCSTVDGGTNENSSKNDCNNLMQADLQSLSVNTLKRVKKFLKIQSRNANKWQMIESIQSEMQLIPVNEKETIAYFIYAVKTGKYVHDSGGCNDNETNDIKCNS